MIEKRPVPNLIGHLVLIIGIIMMAFPIYYTFIASTTTSEAIIRPAYIAAACSQALGR